MGWHKALEPLLIFGSCTVFSVRFLLKGTNIFTIDLSSSVEESTKLFTAGFTFTDFFYDRQKLSVPLMYSCKTFWIHKLTS